ncbi:MAG: DEAD/DEAH box helicase [Myxococcota bacterium]
MDQLDRTPSLQEAPELDPASMVVEYRIDLRESRLRDQLVLVFYGRTPKEPLPHRLELDERAVAAWAGEQDRRLLAWLLGSGPEERGRVGMECRPRFARSVLRPGLYEHVLPELCRTGRLFADLGVPGSTPTGPIRWDEAGFHQLGLVFERDEDGQRLGGRLHRDGQSSSVLEAGLFLSSGLFLEDGHLRRVESAVEGGWAVRLRRTGPIEVPAGAEDRFVVRLAQIPDLPELELPPELHWARVRVPPRPMLELSAETDGLHGVLRFDYDGFRVGPEDRGAHVAQLDGRHLMKRDRGAEQRARERLRGLELLGEGGCLVPRRRVAEVVRTLLGEGWGVETDGDTVRAGGVLKAKIRSGIDWFDLEGGAVFDEDATASWPELLSAAQRGDGFVRLSDGSRGLMPEGLDRYVALARFAVPRMETLRFGTSQAGVLDALLTGHGEVDADIKFERLRRAWKRIDPQKIEEPPGFSGKLRDYQRKGVAWLRWLEATGCGGCLADDMGLGKTVQVLCWLQGRHPPGARPEGPSLIVVPKSLVGNWAAEAAKFTGLSVHVHGGPDRKQKLSRLQEVDLVLTTYGTLRSDILELMDTRFHTVVLDEAQAIKNPRSQSAKAVRLLRTQQKLAVSGTPIENGLDELWSLFDFLNPGMMGDLDVFVAPGRESDDDWLEAVRRSLKPFMLRRTKAQVLTELPGKTEQTIRIPLSDEERRRYDELRDHYRRALKGRIEADGVGGNRIQVLEALLRLRQAACHPGLIDPGRRGEPSSKLDFLVERVRQLAKAGHKTLIFSQFTAMLEIVGPALKEAGVGFVQLDGRTRDRDAVVNRFRECDDCKAFLISIKAGGCGLNLTQSSYVFILDPWWNPAVEAQAVDRANRMGQKNRVVAMRLIGEDTVEEKIVALQAEKRKLADAIVTAEARTLKDLDAADVEALLS